MIRVRKFPDSGKMRAGPNTALVGLTAHDDLTARLIATA
jgi:hypothetical protein